MSYFNSSEAYHRERDVKNIAAYKPKKSVKSLLAIIRWSN